MYCIDSIWSWLSDQTVPLLAFTQQSGLRDWIYSLDLGTYIQFACHNFSIVRMYIVQHATCIFIIIVTMCFWYFHNRTDLHLEATLVRGLMWVNTCVTWVHYVIILKLLKGMSIGCLCVWSMQTSSNRCSWVGGQHTSGSANTQIVLWKTIETIILCLFVLIHSECSPQWWSTAFSTYSA